MPGIASWQKASEAISVVNVDAAVPSRLSAALGAAPVAKVVEDEEGRVYICYNNEMAFETTVQELESGDAVVVHRTYVADAMCIDGNALSVLGLHIGHPQATRSK
jgi:hypothetical protein